MFRPTKEDLVTAVGKTVDDVIASGLTVLFCGINPGLYTAASGRHFARPGNRFWRALYEGGFTPRLLQPSDQSELIKYGCGVTNLVSRATAAASELTADEIRDGRNFLEEKIDRCRPQWVAFVGIGAYRIAYESPYAVLGRQKEEVGGSKVWLLPNTSGLNANHRPSDFARLFGDLQEAAFCQSRLP